jgi:ATP-dependent DNA helicase RecG
MTPETRQPLAEQPPVPAGPAAIERFPATSMPSGDSTAKARPAGRSGSPPAPGNPAPPAGLDTALQFLRGVGPARSRLLAKAGLGTVRDALLFLPGRHEDRSQLAPLATVRPGELHTCAGTIVGVSPPPRGGRSRAPFRALLKDESGFLTAVWFGRPHLERVLTRGRRVVVHGKVEPSPRGRLEINVGDWELADEGEHESLHTGRLVPIYPKIDGIQPRPLRSLMKQIVDGYADLVEESLPGPIRERRSLISIGRAVRAGHFPDSPDDLAAARRRLAFSSASPSAGSGRAAAPASA